MKVFLRIIKGCLPYLLLDKVERIDKKVHSMSSIKKALKEIDLCMLITLKESNKKIIESLQNNVNKKI